MIKDDNEFNAKKSELEVVREDFDHLDRYMKEKGNALTAKVVNLENRTARLEKYVFDTEKPILQIMDKEIGKVKTHLSQQMVM